MAQHDVENRDDIEAIITAFYNKLLKDPIVGFIFTDVVKIHLEQHIPIIVDFWHDALFKTHLYNNNTLQVHLDINQKLPLKNGHFTRWLFLFDEAVETHAKGENADKMKQRAQDVAKAMLASMKKQKKSEQVVSLKEK